MEFELVGDLRDVLYFGRDGEAALQQHADLANQCHKPVTVGHMQPAVLGVQLHQASTRLQATYSQARQ